MRPTWAIIKTFAAMLLTIACFGAIIAAFTQGPTFNSPPPTADSGWEYRGSVIAGYDMYEDAKTGACLVVVERTGCVTKISEKSCVVRRK